MRREAADQLIEAGPQRRAGRACRTTLGKHSPARWRHHFGGRSFISNRLEFRDGHSHGRLLDPIVAATRAASLDASGDTNAVSHARNF